jgi:hypothetical protein
MSGFLVTFPLVIFTPLKLLESLWIMSSLGQLVFLSLWLEFTIPQDGVGFGTWSTRYGLSMRLIYYSQNLTSICCGREINWLEVWFVAASCFSSLFHAHWPLWWWRTRCTARIRGPVVRWDSTSPALAVVMPSALQQTVLKFVAFLCEFCLCLTAKSSPILAVEVPETHRNNRCILVCCLAFPWCHVDSWGGSHLSALQQSVVSARLVFGSDLARVSCA